MKSPITGKEMKLHKEKVIQTFRKEQFEVVHHSYLCEDSGEQFESEELVDLNATQVYNQYRAKYNLPFPDEIKSIREQYGLPANKMSEVLGFGVNVYRGYENGEVPSESNARLIQLAKDYKEFKKLLVLSGVYKGEELQKLMELIDNKIYESENEFSDDFFIEYAMGDNIADEYTGFKLPSLEKFTQMVIFFAETQPWKTKLNKLLFYADFLHFKRTYFSISGARYKAIQMGPVPVNFNTLFDYIANNDYVDVIVTEFNNGGIGEQFKARSDQKFEKSLFSGTELKALEDVAKKFSKTSTKDMIELSHAETAWEYNVEGFDKIAYQYGFDLKNV